MHIAENAAHTIGEINTGGNRMKQWLSWLTVGLTAAMLLAAAACTSGGNVDDNNSSVSKHSSMGTSSTGVVSHMIQDVESDLGINGSSGSAGSSSAASGLASGTETSSK